MNEKAKSLLKTTLKTSALTLAVVASLAGAKQFKNAQKNSKQMVADAFVGTAEPSMVQVQTVVSEIPTYMTNNEGTRFTVVNNAETQATNEAVAAAESQDDEASFNNNNDSTSKRGSAADRFTESALDKVGAESESDLEKDGFVPSDETQKFSTNLKKAIQILQLIQLMTQITEQILMKLKTLNLNKTHQKLEFQTKQLHMQ